MNADLSARVGEKTYRRFGRWQHAFWWHGLRALMFLSCVHAVIAASLLPIFGALTAMLYVVIPPIVTIIAYDAIKDAPLFALLCLALAIGATAVLWPLARTVARALPFFPRIFSLLIFAIWLPTLSAESLRWALIQNEIVQARPQCHGAMTLLASLQYRNDLNDFDYGFPPHAWMLKDGTMQLWSYRSLRFEPAPGWRGVHDCETAIQAANPSIGQQW